MLDLTVPNEQTMNSPIVVQQTENSSYTGQIKIPKEW